MAEPVDVAPNAMVFANDSPAAITLNPYTISLSVVRLSPSKNFSVTKSSEDFSYFT